MPSISIVIIDRNGKIKEQNIKEFKEDELYKKAGFKTNSGFKKQTTWSFDVKGKKIKIAVYGKTDGRAGQENKYEFPPPIDKILFFGSCVLVNFWITETTEEKAVDLHVGDWKQAYDFLMGGFDDLDDDEETSEEEETETMGIEGYDRDGFVVDDDDLEYEAEEFVDKSDSEDEEFLKKKKKSASKKAAAKSVKKPRASAGKKKTEEVVVDLETKTNQDNLYLDCQSELVEEEYV